MKRGVLGAALISTTLFVGAASAALTGPVKDGWITGQIEAVYALNPRLTTFTIRAETTNGTVQLTGTVETDIDRDLAGEVAKGIDGVVAVDNAIRVSPSAREAVRAKTFDGRPFNVWIGDLTTTATIKTKLLADPNTGGSKIDVDTHSNIVTLTGEVASDQERQFAGRLARDTADVKQVHNQLVVGAPDDRTGR